MKCIKRANYHDTSTLPECSRNAMLEPVALHIQVRNLPVLRIQSTAPMGGWSGGSPIKFVLWEDIRSGPPGGQILVFGTDYDRTQTLQQDAFPKI